MVSDFRTVSEVAATHVVHIPSQTTGDEGWDRFTFSIKLEDFRRKIDEKQVLLCIRFSVDGNEWWDSNDGNNYRFAFKKVQPVKRRSRMFDLSQTQPESPTSPRSPIAAAPLPGTRGSNFGRMTGWNFPGMGNPDASPSKGTLGQPNAHSPQAQRVSLPRRTSDTNRHPPSFAVPPPPDVHEHLKLKAYCAPAPPLSPPKEAVTTLIQHKEAVRRPFLSQVIGGQYASLPPVEAASHERRRSWGGESIDDEATSAKKDSSWTPQPESESKTLSPPTSSDTTNTSSVVVKPNAVIQTTQTSEQQVFQQEDAKLADLNRAVNELSLFTPPSSALSSPPANDPESETASTSSPSPASSTGELQHEGVDLPEVVVDPLERDDEMEAAASGSDGIHSDSYQDFVSHMHSFLYHFIVANLLSYSLSDQEVLLFQQLQFSDSVSCPLAFAHSAGIPTKQHES